MIHIAFKLFETIRRTIMSQEAMSARGTESHTVIVFNYFFVCQHTFLGKGFAPIIIITILGGFQYQIGGTCQFLLRHVKFGSISFFSRYTFKAIGLKVMKIREIGKI